MKFTSFTKEVHKHYSHFSYAPHLDCMEVEPPSEKKSFSLLTTFAGGAAASLFRFFFRGVFFFLGVFFFFDGFFVFPLDGHGASSSTAFFFFPFDGPGVSSGVFLYVEISMLNHKSSKMHMVVGGRE